MDSHPKITVLLPVYNGDKYLRESIESILKQTFNNFELIIINDGSTDNSLKIAKSFNDPRIKIINNKKNLGIIKSLNIGLSQAKGKYIARLDADDISLKNRLETQYSFLEKNKDIILIGGWAEIINDKGEYIRKKTPVTSFEQIKYWAMFIGNPFIHSSVFFRKDNIKSIGGYSHNYKHVEDYDLYLRLIKNGYKIINLPEIFIKYRIHDQSIGQSRDSKKEQNANVKKIIFNNINHYFLLNWREFEIIYDKQRMRGIKNLFRATYLYRQIFKNYKSKEKLSSGQIKKIKPIYRQRQKWIIKQYIKNLIFSKNRTKK